MGLRTTSKVAGWAFIALLVSQVGYLVASQVIWHATKQPSTDFVAGISVYASAFFIFMVPHGFVTLSIITAIYPRMSRSVQDADTRPPAHRVPPRAGAAAVLTIPATFALVVFALPVVTLLFSSRDPREIPAMALVLAVMAPGIVPFGIDVLNQRFFFAHDDGRMVFCEQVVLSSSPPGSPSWPCVRPEITVAVCRWGWSSATSARRVRHVVRPAARSGRSASARWPSSWARMVAAALVGAAVAYLATTPLRGRADGTGGGVR